MVKQITKMADKTEEKIVLIPAEKLKPNKIIRADIESRTFEYNLDLLENSIKSQGILTPLLVTESGDDYLIVDGNRRYVAGTRAKIKEFPCIIKKEINENNLDRITELGFSANEMRQDLLPSEETEALKKVCEEGNLTLEQIAEATGKTVDQLYRISSRKNLAPEVKEMMDKEEISKTTAGRLTSLPHEEQVQVVQTLKSLNIPITDPTVKLYRGHRLTPRDGISKKVVKRLKENIGVLAEELDNLGKLHKNLTEEINNTHRLVKKIWRITELNDYIHKKYPQIYKDFKSILEILGY